MLTTMVTYYPKPLAFEDIKGFVEGLVTLMVPGFALINSSKTTDHYCNLHPKPHTSEAESISNCLRS